MRDLQQTPPDPMQPQANHTIFQPVSIDLIYPGGLFSEVQLFIVLKLIAEKVHVLKKIPRHKYLLASLQIQYMLREINQCILIQVFQIQSINTFTRSTDSTSQNSGGSSAGVTSTL